MTVGVSVQYTDVYGKTKRGNYSAADDTAATALLPLLKALTNCAITEAHTLHPLVLSGITSNTASAADMSAAEAQAEITYSGPALSGGRRRERVSIKIPAIKAALVTTDNRINILNSAVVALTDQMVSAHGGTLDRADSGKVL